MSTDTDRERRAQAMRARFLKNEGERFDEWLANEREESRRQGWLEACRWGIGVQKQRRENEHGH